MSEQSRQSLAVIGAGAAGITAAHLLQRSHDVTLFEANDYLGGHTHTIMLPDGPDAGTPVDTGFIVMNDRTYPTLIRLLADLGVPRRQTTMSFSFHDQTSGFCYAGTGLNGLFARRRNAVDPAFWRMLAGIRRFSRNALADLEAGRLDGLTLGQYLVRNAYTADFCERYLLPMGSAIWSATTRDLLAFPAASIVHFFRNHGLLSLRDRPRWQTVVGGSHSYVRAFAARFRGRIELATPIRAVRREADRVVVERGDGRGDAFDYVVIAAHADDALRLLVDPSADERRLLGAWRYQPNRTVLHADASALPPQARARACWNYCRETGADPEQALSVTYSMNRLQGLRTRREYCVSLNRHAPCAPGTVIAEMTYAHPQYTFAAVASQRELPALNGQRRTFFCGSYFGYGFHEDAVAAGAAVGAAFGHSL